VRMPEPTRPFGLSVGTAPPPVITPIARRRRRQPPSPRASTPHKTSGNGQHAALYLSRYIYRVALTSTPHLERARSLLNLHSALSRATLPEEPADRTGDAVHDPVPLTAYLRCPVCPRGHLECIDRFRRSRAPRSPGRRTATRSPSPRPPPDCPRRSSEAASAHAAGTARRPATPPWTCPQGTPSPTDGSRSRLRHRPNGVNRVS